MAGIDMTGWKMWEHGVPESRWEVLYECSEKRYGQKVWHCRCSCDAHTEKDIPGGELRRGKTKSCGCYRKDYMAETKSVDLTGQTFGELTVVCDSGKRAAGGAIIWKCSCSCGNDNYEIPSSDLTKKIKRGALHCGRPIHRIIDLRGQTFGDLEVIEIDESTVGTAEGVKWWCKCNLCNKTELTSILGASLVSGKTKSCGCGMNFSRGAKKTLSILTEAYNVDNIKQEVTFDDFYNPDTKRHYRFDFGVYDDNNNLLFLVEYDGEQHFYYQDNSASWNTYERFQQVQAYDKIKNQYCLEKGIPLYRLPYYDIERINTIEDIKKYLVTQITRDLNVAR